ncbi:constitutive coactivator of peroxisome proliferator-activated receptor gamma-like isoform X2 [Acanthaster planci]|uniref:Constitutive coactivator of peroxisome proliferator-activated receptor gamma-like isoform X2 n=1 Tax=Acanthaster planci TaxID=133434 RepID=A0A8B7XSP8_ACAPL|nr:constitutive coactivator of peroxisome proliferator-activated receptor gamma-like isoform X2 [Acanthaster planci]
MGVKGLQGFADNCPGVLVQVNIAHLAADFQRHHDRKPVLLVDGMGCMRTFFSPRTPWIFSGQWKLLLDRIKCFVDAFTAVGIELVFIFDGVIENSKIAEWVKRRNEEIKKVGKIFQSIKKDGRHPNDSLLYLPSGLSFFSQQALKIHGATVYSSVIEADRAIFQFYRKYQAFGVLGQDSDFLVYDIHNYFSLNSLQFERRLEVKRYDRGRLCRQLCLQPFHLPLLACLMGNDVIAHESLSGFHSRLTGRPSNRFSDLLPVVARFLSDLQIGCLTPKVVADLELRVFGEAKHMLGLMDKVVSQYVQLTEPEPPAVTHVRSGCMEQRQDQALVKSSPQSRSGSRAGVEDQLTFQDKSTASQCQTQLFEALRKAHVNANIPSRIFNLFSDHVYQRRPGLEDSTDSTMPTAGLLLQPIRKRMYGLILGVGPEEDVSISRLPTSALCGASASATSSSCSDTTAKHLPSLCTPLQGLVIGVNAVKEWVACPGHTLAMEPEIVQAEPLNVPGRTPQLEAFWLGPQAEAWPLKLRVFLACMHCDLDPALLHRLPVHLILLCVLLRYFDQHSTPRFLRENDVDAFVAQAVCLPMYTLASLENLRATAIEDFYLVRSCIYSRAPVSEHQ